MSTFNGVVAEFPYIRIDNFQSRPDASPPLACFLSHVHSDHLRGLESLKSPFVYCSAATREILLRLEKYPHRMNFAKGILETRKQTYRHLKNLLKVIPLETPTEIELCPGKIIRVTLLDANHCVGAVMFLIEGDGKAILYTGDIRSEKWWVDALVRNPVLIPYTKGKKRLDTMYLDTTFATQEQSHRHFPPKADGLDELLRKTDQYPANTIFYIDAWTFGYEDVWRALSAHLDTKVHLDSYRYRLYKSLGEQVQCFGPETAGLVGFQMGNHVREGCLTRDEIEPRLHSCERGTRCHVFNDRNVVRITPIITRHEGYEYGEAGAGGGQGDLDQVHELELNDMHIVGQLMALCSARLQKQPEIMPDLMSLIASSAQTGNIRLDVSTLLEEDDENDALENLPLDRLLPHSPNSAQVTFPYSRHSSYEELRWLVAAFRPKDIYPNTVNERLWTPSVSMETLFGDLCSGDVFAHDRSMLRLTGHANGDKGSSRRFEQESQNEGVSDSDREITSPKLAPPPAGSTKRPHGPHSPALEQQPKRSKQVVDDSTTTTTPLRKSLPSSSATSSANQVSGPATPETPKDRVRERLARRRAAHDAAMGVGGRTWHDVSLTSVSGYHNQGPEEEL
ncbi:hypothetical protein H2203_004594 [Taxawa tesnikishii (nom. ined.)]|nr:hypothetical protein H2203_004594 [Dothideales sp. JES 119]